MYIIFAKGEVAQTILGNSSHIISIISKGLEIKFLKRHKVTKQNKLL